MRRCLVFGVVSLSLLLGGIGLAAAICLTSCATGSSRLIASGDGGPQSNSPPLSDARAHEAVSQGSGFSGGGNGAETEGGPYSPENFRISFDETIEWPTIPFVDPRDGSSYEIIDGQVLVALRAYTPAPVMDGNFFENATQQQINAYQALLPYPETYLSDPDVQNFLLTENLLVFSEWAEVGGLACLLPPGQTVLDAVTNWVTEYPDLLANVDPNMLVGTDAVPNPDDDLFPVQWHAASSFAYDIHVQEAWTDNLPSVTAPTDRVVAVLDSGVQYDPVHLSDLSARSTPLGCNTGSQDCSTTFTSRSSGGGQMWPQWINKNAGFAQSAGHGTCCAGIIAAQIDNDAGAFPVLDDGKDIAGVSYAPKYFPVAIKQNKPGWFDAAGILNALQAVAIIMGKHPANTCQLSQPIPYDYKIEVVSMSFNGGGDNYLGNLYLGEIGPYTTLIASVGNNGSATEVTWPAKHSLVVGVAAHDNTGRRSVWGNKSSNYSPLTTDLSAPGSDVWTTDMWGVNTRGDRLGYSGEGIEGFGEYETIFEFDGTSASCPVVAGAAILVTTKNLNWTPAQVRDRLTATARKDFDLHLDNPPVFNGKGRLNVQKAMQ